MTTTTQNDTEICICREQFFCSLERRGKLWGPSRRFAAGVGWNQRNEERRKIKHRRSSDGTNKTHSDGRYEGKLNSIKPQQRVPNYADSSLFSFSYVRSFCFWSWAWTQPVPIMPAYTAQCIRKRGKWQRFARKKGGREGHWKIILKRRRG